MSNANLKTLVSDVASHSDGGVDEDEDVGGEGGCPRLNSRSTASRNHDASSGQGTSRRVPQVSNLDDTDAQSSGNDSAERECEAHIGREASTCSSHNGKDSAVETTETKSSNSQSPSPPSSSMAYSLLSGSSEQDHPSTSGCSSDQSARLQTQKELLKALRELKIRVPADHRGKGRSSTLASLQYALTCVKQVRANQEYYHQWNVEETHGCCLDLSTFTVEELDNITSEYTLQNTDTFSVAVSFLTGRVVYISPQASPLLRCKPESLQGALFSELLAPQDVSTFYSGTAPWRLPPWATCTGSTSPMDCAQEKSMFCRISRGKDSGGEVRYHPFRLTPYQLTIRDCDNSQPQPCCLLIAEKVHSGYEAPRIPTDKRIFTTSHTPSCLFQEVDERAVPLLGYLPQDLVGTQMLLYLHPEDRPLMVAIHKKILQFAGQPFDYAPLRMCARSGEYLTIDTSWSSFINPWSRKVAFIVGRHKVRTSPLNEDMFTPPAGGDMRAMCPEVAQLSEQIHRLLVQPVHSGGSQGYCSLGSNGSYELHPSAGSSSESNGPAVDESLQRHKTMTFQQICKDVHMVKTSGQQVFMESRNRPKLCKHTSSGALNNLKLGDMEMTPREGPKGNPAPSKSLSSTEPPRKGLASTYSYQQINCLDSIVRYLESCNVPNTVKRKCGSSSCTTSSTSDDDKQRDASGTRKGMVDPLVVSEEAKVGPPASTHPLTPLALHCKAESVVSVTSQCSFSSTIVHVGDKKPPESDIVMMEEPPTTPTPAPSTPAPATSTTIGAVPPQASTSPCPGPREKDGSRGGVEVACMGLTKEVLSAHTQQEEQAFLSRFRDLSQLRVPQPSAPPQRGHSSVHVPNGSKGVRSSQDYPAGGSGRRRRGRGGKRLKHQQEGGSIQATIPDCPSLAGSLPFYAPYPSFPQQPPSALAPDPIMQQGPAFPLQAPPLLPHMAPPVMAFILPNYMFPQLAGPMASLSPTATTLPQLSQALPLNALGQFNPPILPRNPGLAPFNAPLNHFNPPNAHFNPAMPLIRQEQFCGPPPVFPFPNGSPMPPPVLLQAGVPQVALPQRGPSRSSTPQSTCQPAGEREGTDSPLFPSRCSSPLNLLQLEEVPSNRPEALGGARQQTPPPANGPGQDWQGMQGGGIGGQVSANQSNTNVAEMKDNGGANDSNQDAMSTSSDLLDLLLQEDSRSGTGSAASGSGSSGSGSGSGLSGSGLSGSGLSGSGLSGSGSNGCSTSGSGTRSSNTSKYFGSIDSSENDHSNKPASGDEQFIKYILQDPIWVLMANTDDKVMMTYQLPSRDREAVLREDRAILKAVQKQQPHFNEEQQKELSEVHPWMRTGRLPRTFTTTACTGCGAVADSVETLPLDVELHEMDLTSVLHLQDVSVDQEPHVTTADAEPPTSPLSESEAAQTARRGRGKPADTSTPDATAEEPEVTSSLEGSAE